MDDWINGGSDSGVFTLFANLSNLRRNQRMRVKTMNRLISNVTPFIIFILSSKLLLISSESVADVLSLKYDKAAFNFTKCGRGWQEKFVSLQKDQLLYRNESSRVLVSTSGGRPQGANDRIAGLLTEFFAALLSGRAFQIHCYSGWAEFEIAFDAPNIDWIIRDSIRSSLVQDIIQNRTNSSDAVALLYENGYPLFSKEFEEQYSDAAPLIFGSVPTVVVQSNRGNIHRLLDVESPFHRFFANFGMSPGNGVFCAFHFLFSPRPNVIQLAIPFSSKLADPDTLKIGIQIRTGDEAFFMVPKETLDNSHYYQNFFGCAKHLESIHNPTGSKRVIWYLMSDSMHLRKDAVGLYGDKVLTDLNHSAIHIGNAGTHEERAEGLQLVMAEVYTFSLCDYFILSHNSGIAKLAVWISNNRREDNVFVEHRDQPAQQDNLCIPFSTHDMVMGGAGLRRTVK